MAKELLYTGRIVYAQEALRIGLMNHVVPATSLMDKAKELAGTIASNYPQAVQGTKRLLIENLGMSWSGMHENEKTARRSTYKGQSIEEGFREFIARKGRPTGPQS